MKSVMRFIAFILKTLIALVLVIGLCAAGFLVSMNTTNIYVLINDGLNERAKVILYNNDTVDMSKYFTPYFMETDEYIALRDKYSSYNINSFGYKVSCRTLFTMPWATRTQIVVDEAVYAIDGTKDTAVQSKDEAMLAGTYYPPEWKNTTYRVTLIKQDDRWVIEKLEYVADYAFAQPTQRSLPPDVLEAIRPTPTPTPSVTKAPNQTATATPTSTPLVTYPGTIINVSKKLNVRSGPGTSHEIVGSLVNGDIVNIVSATDNWYCIVWQDGTAYVSASYVKVEELVE